ncbi:EAL domain-containing protein [Legionella hackeliae]|uniref:EAL domain protein n=2 Tax=Legionella hackeliae TaxID=449 RepID=A0A0A8UVC8_LEGHA|nr:EAL domain-containing protein [Legionella hackeliae]KTD11453.1 Rtn protein [Legionella hackeliae]CEK10714.1 EAL domain protein [Legionella hackeliae]STX47463.1 Rtn protein [Legionella hackeliae]
MLLTVIFLILVLYFEWSHFERERRRQIQFVADELKLKTDNLIEEALKSAYSFPLYGRNFHDCKNDLIYRLRSVVFNHPAISAIVISDIHNKVICSTLGKNYSLPPPSAVSPTLFGPLAIDDLRENAFLLQQKLGDYYLGIYIVQPIIQKILNSVPNEIIFSGLYSQSQKKFVLYHGMDPGGVLANLNSSNLVQAQLQNLDEFKIILLVHQKHFTAGFLYHLLFAVLIILLVSYLLYLQIRNILNKRFSLGHAINTAIKNNSFQPVYQPVMDCEQNKYCGAEILLRWKTDVHEIMPDLFIEEAEQSGLIVPMTLQVLRKAFKETHLFLSTKPDFHLAVNLSAAHFQDNDFFIQFYQLCEQYEIRPQQIMIELTERELFDQTNKKLMARMHELRTRGHSLAIDDFGTGHASIKYLQHFPFNYLKIDKIFIHAIGTGAITENLNQAIIHMGNSLKLEIIAEGVETKEQFIFLRQCQVRFMQGWFFEKAVPYEHLIKILMD